MSKTVLALVFSLMLTACSTEENYGGPLGGGADAVGGGVVQGGSQNLTLAWVAPVEREDGSPISMAEIAGYRIYYGETAGVYTNEVDVHDGDTMQVTLNNIPNGIYYIVVTTLDMEGRESAFSETIVVSV